MSVVIEACVVAPLNTGQSILLSSPWDQRPLLGQLVLGGQSYMTKVIRVEREDVYDILRYPNLSPHSAQNKYSVSPPLTRGSCS